MNFVFSLTMAAAIVKYSHYYFQSVKERRKFKKKKKKEIETTPLRYKILFGRKDKRIFSPLNGISETNGGYTWSNRIEEFFLSGKRNRKIIKRKEKKRGLR